MKAILEVGELYSVPDPITKIQHPADGYRQTDLREDSEGLTASVGEHGIKVPLLTREVPDSDQWEIVDGNRRFRAYKAAGRTDPIPVRHLGKVSMLDARIIAMHVNEQRAEVFWAERATELLRIKRLGKFTNEEAARRVGMKPAMASKLLTIVEDADDEFIRDLLRTRPKFTDVYETKKKGRVTKPMQRRRVTFKAGDISATVMIGKGVTLCSALRDFFAAQIAKIEALGPDAPVSRLKS